jgi:primosomal protein N''
MTECEIGYRTNQAEFDLILGNLTTACALAPNLQTLKVRFCRALFSDTGILRSPFQVQDLKRIRNEIRDMVKASLGNAKKVSVVSEAWGLHS